MLSRCRAEPAAIAAASWLRSAKFLKEVERSWCLPPRALTGTHCCFQDHNFIKRPSDPDPDPRPTPNLDPHPNYNPSTDLNPIPNPKSNPWCERSRRTIVERREEAERDRSAVGAEGRPDGQARVAAGGREHPEAAGGRRADAGAQELPWRQARAVQPAGRTLAGQSGRVGD